MEWKSVIGYEDQYQISEYGEVRPKIYFARRKVPTLHNGYLRVALYKENKSKYYYIQRLVYEAFVEEIPEGYVVHHVDEDRMNNYFKNLELMTPQEHGALSSYRRWDKFWQSKAQRGIDRS